MLKCPWCNFTTSTSGGLYMHISRMHSQVRRCPFCGRMCKNLSGVKMHMRMKHKITLHEYITISTVK